MLAKTMLTCALTLGVMNTASAYVGPGAGLSLLGALWGLLAAVVAALGFVLLWPLRKMMRTRREKVTPAQAQNGTPETGEAQVADASGIPVATELPARSKHRAQQA